MATFKQFAADAKNFLNSDAGQFAKSAALITAYYGAGMLLAKKFNPTKATFGNAAVTGALNMALLGAFGAAMTHAKDRERQYWEDCAHELREDLSRARDRIVRAEKRIVEMKREAAEREETSMPQDVCRIHDQLQKLQAEMAV